MNTFIVVLIVIVMLVGLFMLIQFMRSKTYKGDDKSLEYKNNLPILPRAERVDAVVEPEPSNDDIKINLGDEDALSRLAHAAENSSNQSQQTINHQTMAGEREGRDILTTVKHTFDSNSPILDHHLNKEENFEQNNDPLLNAKDTVTLFITPYNHTVGISGKEVMTKMTKGVQVFYGLVCWGLDVMAMFRILTQIHCLNSVFQDYHYFYLCRIHTPTELIKLWSVQLVLLLGHCMQKFMMRAVTHLMMKILIN